MEKKCNCKKFLAKKLLSFLSLTVALLLGLNSIVSANPSAQESVVSIDFKKAKLRTVLNEIQKQTSYDFMYSRKFLDDNQEVTAQFVKTKLSVVLEKILGEKYKFTYDSKIIVISPKVSQDEQKKVKGVVTDKAGAPIPGVSIVIKGTTVGTATNNKGEFVILVEKGDIIKVSFIGMISKEVKIKNFKHLTIKLEEEVAELGEVIVNGFKTVKKDHFTGNATVVNKKELLKSNPKNVIQALQLFDPSFRIRENNNWGSDPNAMPEFNIRGESSIGMEKGVDVSVSRIGQRNNLQNNPNLPIFIMDGFEVKVQAIYDMDINRIENITILKDAAATALYGSRAANGVLIIRTTAPKDGKFRVTYNLTTSLDLPDLSDYNMCKAAEKLEVERLSGTYTGTSDYSTIDKFVEYSSKQHLLQQGVETDWMAQPLKNVLNHKHSLYVEGGSGHIRYGIDLNIDKNSGVMKGSYRNRKSVGFNFLYTFGNLNIRNKISYDNTKSENSPYGLFVDYVQMHPYFKIYNEDGELIQNYNKYNVFKNPNPLYKTRLYSYDGRTNYNSIRNNFDVDYKFAKNFRFKTQFTVQKTFQDKESFKDPSALEYMLKDEEEKGELYRDHYNTTSINAKTLLYFTKKMDKHFFNAVGGFEITEDSSTDNYSIFRGFQLGSLNDPLYAAQQKNKSVYKDDKSRQTGFLSSFNYSYNDTYLLDGSFRYDGSSKFGSDKRFAPFWSIGTGVNLHKLDFMANVPWMSRLKIRASYGSTGKMKFESYFAATTFEVDEENWSRTGPASYLVAMGNTDLKWETTYTFDTGIDIGLFNGRANIQANFYKKNTVDLITDFYLMRSSGFEKYKVNSGEIENLGYELFANAIVLRSDKMLMRVYGNLSSNTNKIKKLSKALEDYNKTINEKYDDEITIDEYKVLQTPFQQYYQGASTTAIYAVQSDGIDPSNGKERFRKKDGSTTYTWCANDQVKCGDRTPDIQGSFGFNMGYSGLFLNVSFLYEYGGQKYNSTLINRVESAPVKDYNVDRRCFTSKWIKPGDITPYANIRANTKVKPTTRFLQDNNFISLNSLSLGYDFNPKLIKALGLNTLGLKLNFNDICRWSTIKVERGINYPYTRSYSFNLNLSF